jgi:hypothetical protein
MGSFLIEFWPENLKKSPKRVKGKVLNGGFCSKKYGIQTKHSRKSTKIQTRRKIAHLYRSRRKNKLPFKSKRTWRFLGTTHRYQ